MGEDMRVLVCIKLESIHSVCKVEVDNIPREYGDKNLLPFEDNWKMLSSFEVQRWSEASTDSYVWRSVCFMLIK